MKTKRIRKGKYAIPGHPECTIESWTEGRTYWDIWFNGRAAWLGHFNTKRDCLAAIKKAGLESIRKSAESNE